MKKSYFYKIVFLFIFSILIINKGETQVLISSESGTPDGSAILEVRSVTQGLLIPGMTTAQRILISSPADGLLVFDTSDNAFYIYGNGKWTDLSMSAEIWSQNATDVYLSDDSKNVGVGTTAPSGKFVIKADGSKAPDDVLFEIQDASGDPVFVVTSEGARLYVKDLSKGVSGGFAVGKYGIAKKGIPDTTYFMVSADSTRVYTDYAAGVSGGFAVGKYGIAKDKQNYSFYTGKDSTRVYTDGSAKGVSGGFAVGKYGIAKGVQNYTFVTTKDSTRVYTDTGTKGVSGGFAVGKYGIAKGAEDMYFHTNKDSTRVYIPDTGTVGVMGGFAVTGNDGGVTDDYFNVTGNDSVELINNKKKIMWYPQKSAFLGGEVHVGSVDSVGTNSVALGYRSIAMGDWSQAFGYESKALGTYSTAIGFEAEADTNSFAIGYSAKATGNDAFALGEASAEGDNSYAFGSPGLDAGGSPTEKPKATGDYSYAIGSGSVSSGESSFSFGVQDTSSGQFSIAIGSFSRAIARGSIAIGYEVESSGMYSFASGDGSIASGLRSVAMGYGSTASGYASFSAGRYNEASGSYSTAFGRLDTASGSYSTVFGYQNKVTGNNAASMGFHTTAQSYASLVIGQYNVVTGTTGSWQSDEPLLVAGNGLSGIPHNAMTLYKNGDMTIAGTLTQLSDISLKKNIESISGVLPIIKKINPVYFEFKNKEIYPSDRQIGFIAQNIQKYYPEMVKKGENGMLSVNYSGMSVILLQAINEQQELIQKQQEENKILKEQIEEINNKLDKLMNKQ